jgi:hypothetical protein
MSKKFQKDIYSQEADADLEASELEQGFLDENSKQRSPDLLSAKDGKDESLEANIETEAEENQKDVDDTEERNDFAGGNANENEGESDKDAKQDQEENDNKEEAEELVGDDSKEREDESDNEEGSQSDEPEGSDKSEDEESAEESSEDLDSGEDEHKSDTEEVEPLDESDRLDETDNPEKSKDEESAEESSEDLDSGEYEDKADLENADEQESEDGDESARASSETVNKIRGSQGVVVHDTEITPDGMEFYQPPDMPIAATGSIEQQPFIRKSYAKTLFIIMLLLAGLVVYALFFDTEGKVIDWFEQLKGLVPGIQ